MVVLDCGVEVGPNGCYFGFCLLVEQCVSMFPGILRVLTKSLHISEHPSLSYVAVSFIGYDRVMLSQASPMYTQEAA